MKKRSMCHQLELVLRKSCCACACAGVLDANHRLDLQVVHEKSVSSALSERISADSAPIDCDLLGLLSKHFGWAAEEAWQQVR